MHGPGIIVRTIEAARIPGKYGNEWQYHSRSDNHSKIACLAITLDLMEHCATLRRDARQEKVIFGINHEMSDFRTGRKKNLDLVLASPSATDEDSNRTLEQLIEAYHLVLDDAASTALQSLTQLHEGGVGAVRMALEAKACMTAHQKARPRLYDELSSSHQTIHGASDVAIAGGFVMVNASNEFRSSDMNKVDLSAYPDSEHRNHHQQPSATEGVVEKLRELPRRTKRGAEGFDALGIIVVDMENDGGPVTLVEGPPAPEPDDIYHYESMIHRLAQLYDDRYSAS